MRPALTRRLLVIGWDAADWQVIDPLLAQGKMPALQRLIGRGVRGNIATLQPIYSPMLWTSIATGKRAYKHGVHGFTEPAPGGNAVRPISSLARSTKAFWNILNQLGKRSNIVGWWPSHPAEPIRGSMVSNHFQTAPPVPQAAGDSTTKFVEGGSIDPPAWPMLPGTVHPPSLAAHLAEFRVHPVELTAEHILPFVPRLRDIDQAKDKGPQTIAKTLAEITSIHSAATALMQLEPWDVMAVYYDGIDHFGHAFMRYHPPRLPWVPEQQFELYKGVIEAAYRYHDMMLGTLLALAGDDTTVVLLSDHGFRSDHLRPRSVPLEPAGPAAEHRELGILVMAGPGVRRGTGRIHGASVLDICPTVLTLFGAPVGLDMDGKPLLTALDTDAEPEHVFSWDAIEGDAGTHPPDARSDATADTEAMRQLIDLGYVEPPPADAQEAVRECMREQRYNLAQAYIDAGLAGAAVPLLDALWREWPREHRFATLLIGCLGDVGEHARRGETIELFASALSQHQAEASSQLRELGPKVAELLKDTDAADPEDGPDTGPTFNSPTPADDNTDDKAGKHRRAAGDRRRERSRVQKLIALATPRPALIQWLRATQAMLTRDAESALPLLAPLVDVAGRDPAFLTQIGLAYMGLRRPDEAARCFRRAIEIDPESADAHVGLTRALVSARQWEAAVDAALTAVELRHFNPAGHTLLGRALIRLDRRDDAERALRVALSQAPLNPAAHAGLAYLAAARGDRAGADEHRSLATNARLRHTLHRRTLHNAGTPTAAASPPVTPVLSGARDSLDFDAVPPPFPRAGGHAPVTIVSGLPRSGTSMMMQMLEAGGIAPFTDRVRDADADNARGYYEHELASRLATERAWLPQARGLAVKIVAQLLPVLPAGERYNIIFMHRDAAHVVASQRAMLHRLGRAGAQLDEPELIARFDRQVGSVLRALTKRPAMRVLHASFDRAHRDPSGVAARLARFLGPGFDAARAALAVDPSLRHQGR